LRLRRSDPSAVGINRRRRGNGFTYELDGAAVRDAEVLARIKALVIPPAWRQVWICPHPAGHIQAVGVDDAGRKQYLYHEKWRIKRDTEKFAHMLDVARALPRLRERVAADLAQRGLVRERVLAATVRLLDTAALRIGGESYADSFGLATLCQEHVSVRGSRVHFRFTGKGGVSMEFDVEDAGLAAVVKGLLRRRADHLFAYREGRDWREVRSEHINEYLRAVSGIDMTAKDFRTWRGTVAAAISLAELGPGEGVTRERKAIAQAMRDAAELLGNTAAIARKSYVDPQLLELYRRGVTISSTDWPRAERETLQLLGGAST
jgi:DNA topoisomerase IB